MPGMRGLQRNQKPVQKMTNFLKTAFNFGEYWKSGTKNVKLQTETDNETKKPMFSMQTPKTQPKNIAATSSFESQTSLIIPSSQ